MYRHLALAAALTLTAPALSVAQTQRTPAQVADGFFQALQTGDVAKAYKDLWGGTFMDKKQADVENLVAQNSAVLRQYGKILGWELVSEKTIAPSLVERIYLVRTENLPVFYRLQFYRASSSCMVVNLYFTDIYKNVQ